ncbi:MAG: DUF89 family protein [candidate division WOR-3 bacterium]|nr:MAG: DUF89 family protein [candidate division WOR-3 bacterium]
MLKQCRKIAELVGADAATEDYLVTQLHDVAKDLSLEEPPSTYTSRILLAAMEFLGTEDPFVEVKQEQNRKAGPLARQADRELDRTDNPLLSALMLAAAGNVIDSGPTHEFRIEDALDDLRFSRDDSGLLIERLAEAKRVLYILDNAGEVMFDELVLKRLDRVELTIAARSTPILNDVTVAEAESLGLGQYGRITGTGSSFLGVDFGTVSDEFRDAYEAADVVIAKGHANFESLVGHGREAFCVLKAKCELVAAPLGVKLGESACYHEKGPRVQGSKGPSERSTKDRDCFYTTRTHESSNPVR